MNINTAVVISIDDQSGVGEARRSAAALTAQTALGDAARSNLAIIVTEATSNLVRHGGGGEIVLQHIGIGEESWIDVLALDNGPGMQNVATSLRDGHSTAGSAGQGLGAIARLSRAFDIFSAPNMGTVLFSRVDNESAKTHRNDAYSPRLFSIGAVCIPLAGEAVCGDAWSADTADSHSCRFLVADGLGHGFDAAQASAEAVRIFGETKRIGQTPARTLETAHSALRATRGAAAAIASIDTAQRSITFAGVGNIQAALASTAGTKNLTSYNGTVGHQAHKFADFTLPWNPEQLLVMASDGIATQWRLERYPGLLLRHPAVIAGVLYRDCRRGRDDATVLVATWNGSEQEAGD